MLTRTAKLQVVPSAQMISNAVSLAANFIEDRDKVPASHTVKCIATGAINSAGPDYQSEIPLRDFCRWEKDSFGKVIVYLDNVKLNETDIYAEIVEPPQLSGDQLAEIQEAVDRLHTTGVLPLGAIRCTDDDLQAFIGLSFQFGINPLPKLRERLKEAGADVEVKADRFGNTVTIRY